MCDMGYMKALWQWLLTSVFFRHWPLTPPSKDGVLMDDVQRTGVDDPCPVLSNLPASTVSLPAVRFQHGFITVSYARCAVSSKTKKPIGECRKALWKPSVMPHSQEHNSSRPEALAVSPPTTQHSNGGLHASPLFSSPLLRSAG